MTTLEEELGGPIADGHALLRECLAQVAALKESAGELMSFADMYRSQSFAYDDGNAIGAGLGWGGGFDFRTSAAMAFTRPSATAAAYIVEAQRRLIVANSRAFCTLNPYWKSIARNRIAYNIGTGHVYSVSPRRPNKKLSEETRYDLLHEIEVFQKVNRYRRRQGERLTRLDRDGESILRLLDDRDDGILRTRFIEPLQLQNPPGMGPAEGVWFGIRFDEYDYEEAISYHVCPMNYDGGTISDAQQAAWIEGIPAANIQHRTANVDLSSPRGIPTTYDLAPRLEQALSTLKAMGKMVDVRARIAVIAKQVNATAATYRRAVRTLGLANLGRPDAGGGMKTAFEYPYGSFINTNDQRSYEFPAQNIETQNIVHSVKADLQSVAGAVGFADFVISADSSSSHSNSLVKEGPMDKAVGCSQQDLIDDDTQVIERHWQIAARHGRIADLTEDDVLDVARLNVEPPTIIARNRIQEAQAAEIYNRCGALSTDTMSEKAGFDPDQERERNKAHPTPLMQQTQVNLDLAKAGLKAAAGGGGGALDNKRSHQSVQHGQAAGRGVPAGSEPGPDANPQRAEEGLQQVVANLREAWQADPTPANQSQLIEAENRLVEARWDRVVDASNLIEACDDQHLIDLPDVRQTNHWSCGAASFLCVCEHFGVGPKTLEEAITLLGTNAKQSTHPHAIVANLMQLGLRVHAQSHMTVGQLATAVKHGRPIIVCLQDYGNVRPSEAEFNFGHYVVVQGVVGKPQNRYVIAQDSSGENADHVPGGDVQADESDNTSDIADLGKIMVPESRWNAAWHDQDAAGVKYLHYGIVVSPAPQQAAEEEEPAVAAAA